MKATVPLVAVIVLVGSLASAQTPVEIPLWASGAPGSEGKNAPEAATRSASGEVSVASIHNPSLTPYPGRSGDIQPTKDSPPVFLAAAYNDRQDISEGLAEAYLRFKRAGVPAELHIYSTGGHGFGLRAANRRPAGAWIVRFEEWLKDSGFVK
jgi:endo-1,4-beta-xylanase